MDIDEYKLRSKESFRHTREIYQPFGKLDDVINWCKVALEDEWRWQMIRSSTDREPGNYIFYFDSERDLLTFSLKWS